MAKILVSGLANTGKTSLLQTLTDVLVIANDGKKYPFKQPHVNIEEVTTSANFIGEIESALERYEAKFNDYPKTLVIDSISKVLLDIESHYISTISSFPYGQIGKDISEVMAYVENELVKNGCNVIFVSHAMKDDDGYFKLVTSGGAAGKRGGVIADVDNAVYIEIRAKKRIIHFKNPKLLARSLNNDLPDSIEAEKFNLQEYLDTLLLTESDTDEWSI